MIYTCTIDTPLGAMTAAAEGEALTGLWFVGQKYYPRQAGQWVTEPDHPVFQALRHWLARYFSGQNGGRDSGADIVLAPHGTPFQKAVWDILLKIPSGQVTTYGQIAGQIALSRGLLSMSAQAVGGAVGHNPISILIPCHRVVGADKALTGYAGGLERKEYLLHLEGADLP